MRRNRISFDEFIKKPWSQMDHNMESNINSNVEFDKECRRHGLGGIEEFEYSIVQRLYEYKTLDFLHKPSWEMDSLKKYYDIGTYLVRKTKDDYYSISAYFIVDDNKLNNYWN